MVDQTIVTLNASLSGDINAALDHKIPVQFMPSGSMTISADGIKKFKDRSEWADNVLHCSYITRAFSPDTLTMHTRPKVGQNPMEAERSARNHILYELEKQCYIAFKTKTRYLLIHGPQTIRECTAAPQAISRIANVLKCYPGVELLVETASYNKDTYASMESQIARSSNKKRTPGQAYLDMTMRIVELIARQGVKAHLCVDTAHLYTWGLKETEIAAAIKHCPVIHLNGQQRTPLSTDVHAPLNSNVDPLYGLNVVNRMNMTVIMREVAKHKPLSIMEIGTKSPANYERIKEFLTASGCSFEWSIEEIERLRLSAFTF